MLNKRALLLASLAVLSLVQGQVVQHYDHIIIGAGISGIGASQTFTKSKAQHLIIQARDRIGGRIKAFTFSGTTQDQGASYLHYPYDDNKIHNLAQQLGIGQIRANFANQAVYYAGNKSIVSKTDLQKAQNAYSSLSDYIYDQVQNVMDVDAPLTTLLQKFYQKNPQISGFIKDRVNEEMLEEAIDNGADLSTMSSWEWEGEHDGSDKWDYAPVGGFYKLALTIFNNMCSPVLHLSEVVKAVDYSGSKIKVTTNKNTYTTNKLIVGVPLGVLKAGSINFTPSLPSSKMTAISKIGFGVFEKLYVTFDKPFWPQGYSMFAFVGKSEDCRYPEAWIVPNNPDNMVIIFLGGSVAKLVGTWSKQQIKADLLKEIAKYINTAVTIKDLYLTKWHQDPFTLGGYSYGKVGTEPKHFKNLRSVLRKESNNIWFIGEHTDPNLYSYTHGAYLSGVKAANEALAL